MGNEWRTYDTYSSTYALNDHASKSSGGNHRVVPISARNLPEGVKELKDKWQHLCCECVKNLEFWGHGRSGFNKKGDQVNYVDLGAGRLWNTKKKDRTPEWYKKNRKDIKRNGDMKALRSYLCDSAQVAFRGCGSFHRW